MSTAVEEPTRTRSRWAPAITTAARYLLAGVWAWAALAKMSDPDAAVRAVRAYKLLPEVLVKPMAWGLPFVELAIGVLLILGLGTRAAGWLSIVFFALFIGIIASVWARGLQIDCGCFGGGGASASVNGASYAWDIGRDVMFAALAALVAFGPRSWFTLDSRIPGGM